MASEYWSGCSLFPNSETGCGMAGGDSRGQGAKLDSPWFGNPGGTSRKAPLYVRIFSSSAIFPFLWLRFISFITARRPVMLFQDTLIRESPKRDVYIKEYVPRMPKCHLLRPAALSVAATSTKCALRGKWKTDMVMIHQFDNTNDIRGWKDTGEHLTNKHLKISLSGL